MMMNSKKCMLLALLAIAGLAFAEVTIRQVESGGATYNKEVKENIKANFDDLAAVVNVGITTNIVYVSADGVTGTIYIASGIVTNFDADISD